MLEQMSMPVLFALLIAVLAVITIGAFLAFRILGGRKKSSDEPAAKPGHGGDDDAATASSPGSDLGQQP